MAMRSPCGRGPTATHSIVQAAVRPARRRVRSRRPDRLRFQGRALWNRKSPSMRPATRSLCGDEDKHPARTRSRFSVKPFGGDSGRRQTRLTSVTNALVPDVSITPAGVDLPLTWAINNGPGFVAQVLVRQANGSLGSPQTLSGTRRRDAMHRTAESERAVNSRGDAIVHVESEATERATSSRRGSNPQPRPRSTRRRRVSDGSAGLRRLLPRSVLSMKLEMQLSCGRTVFPARVTRSRRTSVRLATLRAFLGSRRSSDRRQDVTGFPRVAVDSEGTAIAIWHRHGRRETRCRARCARLNRGIQRSRDPLVVDSATRRFSNDRVRRPSGNAIATWSRQASAVSSWCRPRRDQERRVWRSARTVSAGGVSPRPCAGIGVRPGRQRGTRVGASQSARETRGRGGCDTTPSARRSRASNIPGTAQAGAIVASGRGDRRLVRGDSDDWSFGDGATASGTAVQHVRSGRVQRVGVQLVDEMPSGTTSAPTRSQVVARTQAVAAGRCSRPGSTMTGTASSPARTATTPTPRSGPGRVEVKGNRTRRELRRDRGAVPDADQRRGQQVGRQGQPPDADDAAGHAAVPARAGRRGSSARGKPKCSFTTQDAEGRQGAPGRGDDHLAR